MAYKNAQPVKMHQEPERSPTSLAIQELRADYELLSDEDKLKRIENIRYAERMRSYMRHSLDAVWSNMESALRAKIREADAAVIG